MTKEDYVHILVSGLIGSATTIAILDILDILS